MAENIEQLLQNLESALVLNPNDPFRRVRLGKMYLKAGDVEKAQLAFDRVLRKDPAYADAHHGLGQVRAKKGEPDAALACFRQALSLDPNHFEAHADLARHYEAKGEEASARTHHDVLLRLKPDDPEVLRNAAAHLMRFGHFGVAIPLLERGRKIEPGDRASAVALGIAYVKTEQFAAGRELLRDACQGDDAAPEGLECLAEAHLALSEPARAAEVFQR